MLRKTPHTLPKSQYGGAGKRLFLGLMTGSCLLLCLLILTFWLVPYIGLSAIHPSLPFLSGGLAVALVGLVAWMCAGLAYHVYTGRQLPGLRSIRGLTVRLIFPLMELLGKALGIAREKIRLSFVKVNNEMVLASELRVQPAEVLLLLPHCLQRSQCPLRLSANVELCERCGLCPVGDLLLLRDRWGVHMAVATGGTIARRIVVQLRPKLIVAVACERDLTSGIQDTYPLPVFGVLNQRPLGPCIDTLVSVDVLDEVLRIFVCKEAQPAAMPLAQYPAENTPAVLVDQKVADVHQGQE